MSHRGTESFNVPVRPRSRFLEFPSLPVFAKHNLAGHGQDPSEAYPVRNQEGDILMVCHTGAIYVTSLVAFYCNFNWADGDLNQNSPALLRQWNGRVIVTICTIYRQKTAN